MHTFFQRNITAIPYDFVGRDDPGAPHEPVFSGNRRDALIAPREPVFSGNHRDALIAPREHVFSGNRRVALPVALAVAMLIFFLSCVGAYARDGTGGFDCSGVSSGENPGGGAVEFKEYVFVTGEPVLLTGTLIITKSANGGATASSYSYKLGNAARGVQLTREISYSTTFIPKAGGQTVTNTTLAREPSEKIVFNRQTYTLRRMDFTRTSLIDSRPAINYYSGNTWYRKQYEVGGGAAASASGDYLTVEATGEFYGFDQAWGNADVEETRFLIEYSQNAATAEGGSARELWSGEADVRRSQSTAAELRYVENEPDAISFRGGYLETRRNGNILEFKARFPEFESGGGATDRLRNYSDSAQIINFPASRRLVSPDLRHIRGHWAEDAVARLFGLEIFTARPSEFIPDQFISRAQFAAALSAAAGPVPPEPAPRRNVGTGARGARVAAPAPSFSDVPVNHEFFSQIEDVFARGLMTPVDKKEFGPNRSVSVADAAVAFVRALGLESLASAHGAITEYADDAGIPLYARDALYVAQKIGLLRGDQNGNIYPLKELTMAEAAVMLDRLVEYMRTELKSDYREHIMDY